MNLDDTARMAATIAASVADAATLTFSGGALAHDDCKTPGCTPSHSPYGVTNSTPRMSPMGLEPSLEWSPSGVQGFRPLGQPDSCPPGLKISPKSGPRYRSNVGTTRCGELHGIQRQHRYGHAVRVRLHRDLNGNLANNLTPRFNVEPRLIAAEALSKCRLQTLRKSPVIRP